MSIAKKPKHENKPEEEKEIEALIQKGGSIAVSSQATKGDEGEEKPKNVQVRILPSWLNRIDVVRKKKPIKPLRHPWILEAIHEKLEREEAKYS